MFSSVITVAVNKKFMFRSRTMIVLRCVPIPFRYRFFTVPILYQKTVVPFSIRPTLRFFSPCEIKQSSHGVQLLREAKDRVLLC